MNTIKETEDELMTDQGSYSGRIRNFKSVQVSPTSNKSHNSLKSTIVLSFK
jgi:hypothetical protein